MKNSWGTPKPPIPRRRARAPLLTIATLDALAILCERSGGLRVADAVAARLDAEATWGASVVSPCDLKNFAGDDGDGVGRARPPVYASLCGLLRVPGNDFEVATAAAAFLGAMCSESLGRTEAMRRQADADHERAREAMENEKQLALALKQHNTGLLRERDALVDELEHSQGQIRSLKREVQALQARWQTASNEAGEWAQRAYEAQGETRQALAEANEARNASSAMQRSLLSAQEYRLSEEAGYQLQTIIQMAPSKATLTTVYEQPQTVDAYVQM